MRAGVAVVTALAAGVAGWLVYSQWDRIIAHRTGANEVTGASSDRSTAARRDRDGPPPGAQLDIELLSRPSPVFSPAIEEDEADAEYRRVIATLGAKAVVYDPVLARAAREVAYQSAVIGDSPPEDVLTFLLHSAGAPESHAALFRLSTTSEQGSALSDSIHGALVDAPDGEGTLRMGVGEAATPGERFTRRIIILMARRDYEISPAPRRVDPGATWSLSGRLPRGFSSPVATVLFPDGRLETAEVKSLSPTFSLELPVGDRAGTMYVSIDGIGRQGPGKLFQLEVEVGPELPRKRRVVMPPVQPVFDELADAEAHAFQLLSADRAHAGRQPLRIDPQLSAVARSHSNEMRDNRFFAHQSPTTGLAGDRLTAAGYRSVAHAENLAKNDTLAEAQASLMSSVSHRANIVRETFTHVGIGLAPAREGERDAWYLTQVFATPVVAVDRDAAPGVIVDRINEARRDRGLAALAVDDRLESIAQRGAQRAAGGDTDGLPGAVAEEAKRAVNRGVGVSVHVVYGMDQFEPPEVALAGKLGALGVGVDQSGDDIHGRTGVVVVVSR